MPDPSITNELDKLTLASRAFSKKIMDSLFQNDPLLPHLKGLASIVNGSEYADETDDFADWIRQAKAEQDAIDSINGS